MDSEQQALKISFLHQLFVASACSPHEIPLLTTASPTLPSKVHLGVQCRCTQDMEVKQ